MFVKKAGGTIFGADLTAAEQKALEIEAERQLAEKFAEWTRLHALEVDAVLLWYLHVAFGFGPKNLKKVFMGLAPEIEALRKRYEMHDKGDVVWLCTRLLKEYGVDLEEWSKERGD